MNTAMNSSKLCCILVTLCEEVIDIRILEYEYCTYDSGQGLRDDPNVLSMKDHIRRR